MGTEAASRGVRDGRRAREIMPDIPATELILNAGMTGKRNIAVGLFCFLLHVADGDEIRCGVERIQLIGIDAPEIRFARCAAERRLGRLARRRLRQLLAAGEVEIERKDWPRKDKYGRTTARVFVDGQDVGEALIAEELARPYDGKTRGGWCD